MEISNAIFVYKLKIAMEISKAILFYKHKMAMGVFQRHYANLSSQTKCKMETHLDHFKCHFKAIKLLWQFSVFFFFNEGSQQTNPAY